MTDLARDEDLRSGAHGVLEELAARSRSHRDARDRNVDGPRDEKVCETELRLQMGDELGAPGRGDRSHATEADPLRLGRPGGAGGGRTRRT